MKKIILNLEKRYSAIEKVSFNRKSKLGQCAVKNPILSKQ